MEKYNRFITHNASAINKRLRADKISESDLKFFNKQQKAPPPSTQKEKYI